MERDFEPAEESKIEGESIWSTPFGCRNLSTEMNKGSFKVVLVVFMCCSTPHVYSAKIRRNAPYTQALNFSGVPERSEQTNAPPSKGSNEPSVSKPRTTPAAAMEEAINNDVFSFSVLVLLIALIPVSIMLMAAVLAARRNASHAPDVKRRARRANQGTAYSADVYDHVQVGIAGRRSRRKWGAPKSPVQQSLETGGMRSIYSRERTPPRHGKRRYWPYRQDVG